MEPISFVEVPLEDRPRFEAGQHRFCVGVLQAQGEFSRRPQGRRRLRGLVVSEEELREVH